jgi:hypothetical protein
MLLLHYLAGYGTLRGDLVYFLAGLHRHIGIFLLVINSIFIIYIGLDTGIKSLIRLFSSKPL